MLAADHTQFTIDGHDIQLVSPRIITATEARRILPDSVQPPPRILRITEYLRADTTDP